MKRSKKLIQARSFNDLAAAEAEVEICQKRVNRILIGMLIALISTILTIIGIKRFDNNGMAFLIWAFILAIPAYLIGGGMGRAFKAARTLGKWGWIVTPFPIDIFTGLFTIVIAFFGFFFVPLIFVLMNYSQNNADLKAAKVYLKHCAPVEEPAE